MEIHLTKIDGKLCPSFEDDREKLGAIAEGSEVKAKISVPRNLGFHRKYFALLDVVMNNMPEAFSDRFKTSEDLLWEIKLQLHYFNKHITLGGTVTYRPKSISFAKMDQKKFEAFYSDTIDIILKHIMKGSKKEELDREVELIIGFV